MAIKKNTNKLSDQQKVVKKIHIIGFWLKMLALLYVVLTPIITFVFYSAASSKGYSKQTMLIASIILGLILSGIFLKLGLSVKKTTVKTISHANRLLLYSALYIIFVVILGLVGGGLKGISGLLDLITFVQILLARSQIRKLNR